MFHWICPECGREIAPTAKECTACDPTSVVETAAVNTAPEPPAARRILMPEVMTPATPVAPRHQPVVPEQYLLQAPVTPVALLEPAPAVTTAPEPEPEPQPRIATLPPLSAIRPQTPASTLVEVQPLPPTQDPVELPAHAATLEPAAPQAAAEIPHASLREPESRRPLRETASDSPLEVAPITSALATSLPILATPFSLEPRLAPPVRSLGPAFAGIQPRSGDLCVAGADPSAQLTLPGPTLPYELTSLRAAGIAKMLWFTQAPPQQIRKSGTFISVAVASGFLALAIAAVFYAMPTMARSTPAAEPAPKAVAAAPEPVTPARITPQELEVTGVRFVTDLADRAPQIQYLVVNHTNAPLSGVLVNVTLRAAANQPPLSQFSFRTPRLGPYESKEMFSSIERLNRSLDLPDWRDIQADVELSK